VALHEDRFIVSPGFPIHAIDTTGAGDVFRGGLVYALLQEWGPERALRFANAAAAVSCTRLGALNGVPSRAEIEETMRAELPARQA
jgi:sugar/nucleoside kinase (ribokinase family)